MIEIQNETTGYPEIDREMLLFAIVKTLALMEKKGIDLTLRLTTDDEVHRLNKAFRGIDETTDILSFNQDLIDPESGSLYLGDIVISLDRAVGQAPANDHSLDEECVFLAIHGILHLLGYDHAQEADRKQMWNLQDKIYLKVMNEFQRG